MVVVKFLVFVSEVFSIFSKILTWNIGGQKDTFAPPTQLLGGACPGCPLSLRLCPVQILSQLFAEVFVRGFCPGWFLSVPLLSQYICHNRKLNITLNFMFYMYDKNLYKRDVTCSSPPLPCHKLSHLLGLPPPSNVTYFMDGP